MDCFRKFALGELLWEGRSRRASLRIWSVETMLELCSTRAALHVWSVGTAMHNLLCEAVALLDCSKELLCKSCSARVLCLESFCGHRPCFIGHAL